MADLAARLRRRIEVEGPLSFSEFMQAALHDPADGYYARGPAIGADGDFFTAASLAPFATALAAQARDAWERLGRPAHFRIVEVGGGTGELAARLRAALAPDLAAAARFLLVEPSPGLAAAQRAAGFEVVPALRDLDPAPTFLVANEVLDALPVRVLVGTEKGARERRVGERAGRLAWVEADPPAHLAALDPPPGTQVEVAEGLDAFLGDVARILDPGFALLIDYGSDPLPPRPGGTLRAYRQHRVVEDVLAEPGRQDLTADVDFGRVRAAAEAAGLREVGFTTQGRFLLALGALDRYADRDVESAVAVKTLVLPGGMGERFRVLGLSRGVDGPLAGFAPPW